MAEELNPGTVAGTPHFECGAIDHSPTSPRGFRGATCYGQGARDSIGGGRVNPQRAINAGRPRFSLTGRPLADDPKPAFAAQEARAFYCCVPSGLRRAVSRFHCQEAGRRGRETSINRIEHEDKMFAVIKTGGKQYRVSAEDKITVMALAGEPGDKVTFEGRAVHRQDGAADFAPR